MLSMAPNNNILETQYYYYSLFLFLLCLISTLLIRSATKTETETKTKRVNLHLPPSPPSLPLLGHLHHLFSSSGLYKSLHHLGTQYGPLLYLNLGSSTLLLASSPSMAAQIFKAQDTSFSSRPTLSFANKILYATSSFINAPYGDYWRFLKKLCVTELLGPGQLNRSHDIRTQELHKFLKKIIKSGERSEIVDVGVELVKLTNNVICRMTMSTSTDEAGDVRQLLKKSFELAAKLYVGEMVGPFKRLVTWFYGNKVRDLNKRFDQLLERVLKMHEEFKSDDEIIRKDNKDLMDILLDAHRDEKAQFRISRYDIKAFFTDLIVAGTDTTSQTMQWVIAELINHPHILTKVREEINLITGKTRRLIQESDLPNLPYLQAVVKETLRLHPSGPITTRVCRESCKIEGYEIPKNTPVAINLYTIMRDPTVWEAPDEFRPERFLGLGYPLNKFEGQNCHFVPFGAGRRGCPGTLLAFTLMNSVIGAMIQCFDWKIDTCRVDMQPGKGMSLGMAHPLKCLPVILFNPFN